MLREQPRFWNVKHLKYIVNVATILFTLYAIVNSCFRREPYETCDAPYLIALEGEQADEAKALCSGIRWQIAAACMKCVILRSSEKASQHVHISLQS